MGKQFHTTLNNHAKETKMSEMRYRMKMGEEFEFTAASDEQFLGTLRARHMYAKSDDGEFLRQIAASACESTGKSIDFSDVPSFKRSLMDAGVLEVING
tara:strand:- start:1814 stop:2110 length:297 start_codon:yes stop_codon:yes gene_type:complete